MYIIWNLHDENLKTEYADTVQIIDRKMKLNKHKFKN